MEKFSSDPDKGHFEYFVKLLRYIRINNNLGFKCYAKIEDVALSALLKKSGIKTDNQLIVLSYFRIQHCPDTGRSTGLYIVFYQCGPIYLCTPVPGTVAWASAESEYNVACTLGMTLAHFRMLNI